MDPDASLTEIQRAVQEYYEAVIAGDLRTAEAAATRVADHFCALDDWLQRGGYLPKPWHHDERAPLPLRPVDRGLSGPE